MLDVTPSVRGDEDRRPGTALTVVVASAGRPTILASLVSELRERQTMTSFDLLVVVPDSASLPASGLPGAHVIVGPRGASAQRNAGIRAAGKTEVIVFFDDDAVPRRDYLEQAVDFFRRHPEAVGLTGLVELDGAYAQAIPSGVAAAALDASERRGLTRRWKRSKELYGCNFAYRVEAAPHLRFDECLPLYSWLEDEDFAVRLARHGVLMKVEDCVVVHRGVKSGGREAHLKLGYSQVANPWHLFLKRSFTLRLLVDETVLRTARNVALSFVGPERHWRRERAIGNLLAYADVLRGRDDPGRILRL